MPISTSGLPRARSSPCPPLPSKAMPMVRRIRIPVPMPRNSRASIRTGSSPAASGTICLRKPHRPLPKPSSKSMVIDRRWPLPAHLTISRAFTVKANKLLLATILVSAIAVPIETLAEDKNVVKPMTSAAVKLPIEGEFPSLGGATEWLNSPPLTAAGLRGKVVVLDVWTFTCINWLRTLPYVRAWAEKYKNQGLVVIGVHSPEFEFEKNVDNVRRATKEMRVDYPIAIDSNHAIWRALKNEYWPALYFVDAQGRIRQHHFGEGEYEQAER